MNDIGIWLPLILALVLLMIRIPVSMAFLSGAVFYFGVLATEMPLNMILSKMISAGMSMNLMAIPFFITAGLLMNYTGITSRMMKFADLCVGHMWGGLAQVNVLLSTLMGGLCGSSNADAAMQCKMLVPEMEARGFNRAFSAAVTASSALISPMIPPGVMLILYASITENSVLDMFMAGYLPGILMCITLMVAVNYVSHRDGYKPTREKRAPAKEVFHGLVECFWAIVMIVVLIVGLRTGIVTATEGGAVLCVLCIFVGMLIYKELRPRDLIAVTKEAFTSVANIFGIIISATVFGLYLTYAQIPQQITRLILDMNVGTIGFLMVVNVILLIMGMFVDSSAVLMIAVPLLYPVAMQLGIHPIHFGIVCILNLSIGALTPPFGAIMYQCCHLCKIEMPEFLKQGKELIVALLVTLLLVTFIPGISTLLPTLVK
ncbi:MAG: TRAP transporter large permease [Oscillibacter sp.]